MLLNSKEKAPQRPRAQDSSSILYKSKKNHNFDSLFPEQSRSIKCVVNSTLVCRKRVTVLTSLGALYVKVKFPVII